MVSRELNMTFDISNKDITLAKKDLLISEKPLVFRVFPAKEKRKYILACMLIHYFVENKIYQEFNIIRDVYADFATIRRFLVDYGFLQRSDDGRSYTLNIKKEDYKRFL